LQNKQNNNMKYLYILFLFAIILSACKTTKQVTEDKDEEIGYIPTPTTVKTIYKYDTVVKDHDFYTKITKNYNYRKPNFVIIHHTAQDSCEQTYYTFSLERTQVSSHYVICKDGTITQLVDDYLRAWHAGNSRWGNVTDINSVSIGIELDNNGFTKFAKPQLDSLAELLGRLKKNYGIPAQNFIGHGDIAPQRKNDPNVNFPWEYFAKKGFGIWYDDGELEAPPANFDETIALRIIGYDVKNIDAARTAFNRHFLKLNNEKLISAQGRRVMYSLMKKFMQY
jgi:N-acetylmuramoyl-L-alanine amidase